MKSIRVSRSEVVALAAAAFGVAVGACGSDSRKPAVTATETAASSKPTTANPKEPPAPPRDPSCGGTH